MKNIDRWKYYCTTLTSPDSFIEFGFYFMISSALQRRIWFGGDRAPLFPNQYLIFVADPGVGKGQVSRQVEIMLRFHKYLGKGDKLLAAKLDDNEYPLLFPTAPNAITYEALVKYMGQQVRAISRPNDKVKFYQHCSLIFVLDELASLLRKNTEDTVRFLLQTYDCTDYKNVTLGRGTDIIINSCLNLLAGTQPSHISRIFASGLLSDGLSSRTIFLLEDKKRFIRKNPPHFDDDMRKEWSHIADHIKKLADVYGPIELTPEADEYFEVWWQKIQTSPLNRSPLMRGFQERENMTIVKLAMAVHYADKLDNIITLDEFIRATELLEWAEKKMHLALAIDGKNVVSQVSRDIVKYIIGAGPQLQKQLLVQFFTELPYPASESLTKILEDLVKMDRLRLEGMHYKPTFK